MFAVDSLGPGVGLRFREVGGCRVRCIGLEFRASLDSSLLGTLVCLLSSCPFIFSLQRFVLARLVLLSTCSVLPIGPRYLLHMLYICAQSNPKPRWNHFGSGTFGYGVPRQLFWSF